MPKCEHNFKITKSVRGKPYYKCKKCGATKPYCYHTYEIIKETNSITVMECTICGEIKNKVPHPNRDINDYKRKESDQYKHSAYKMSSHCIERSLNRGISINDIIKTIRKGQFEYISGTELVRYRLNNTFVRVNHARKYIDTCYRIPT